MGLTLLRHFTPALGCAGRGWQTPQARAERSRGAGGKGVEEGGAQARLSLVTGPAPRTLRQHKPISSPHFRSDCVKGHLGEDTPGLKGQSGSNLLTSRSEPQVPPATCLLTHRPLEARAGGPARLGQGWGCCLRDQGLLPAEPRSLERGWGGGGALQPRPGDPAACQAPCKPSPHPGPSTLDTRARNTEMHEAARPDL